MSHRDLKPGNVSHVTTIAPTIDAAAPRFVSSCLCGWKSDPLSRRRAAAAGQMHRANIQVQDL